jgi:hypothetical protein
VTSKSSFKHLKQGDILDGVVVSRVIYERWRNREKRIFFEFVCGCGYVQKTNMGNFKRKPSKVCTRCSIDSVAKQKEKYLIKDRGLYQIWKGMNWRCDPIKGHEAYIRKGITVCQRWAENNPEGFNNFIIDMHPRDGNKTIERIDNTKGYSPDNCKWACMKEQQNNRENNHVIEYMSEKFTVQQLADKIGIKSNTLLCRLRRGWSVEEAVSGVKNKYYKRPYFNKLSDLEFYQMLEELLVKGKDQTSTSIKYGVSSSNLSRITRSNDVLMWYDDYKVGLNQ